MLPIWYEYYPDDHRPREAIEAARKYVAGKIEKATLEKTRAAAVRAGAARSATEAAKWARSSAAWAATSARSVVSHVARWTWRAASGWSEYGAAWEAAAKAAGAVYHYAKEHGNDPDAARAAEKKWQVGRVVQVVEAISRGEDPWHS